MKWLLLLSTLSLISDSPARMEQCWLTAGDQTWQVPVRICKATGVLP